MPNKVKSTVLLFSICLAIVHLCFGQSFTTPRADVTVTVLDEQGMPIADAEVRGLYKGMRAAIDDTVDKKMTPSNGVVELSGKSFWPVSVTARKEGYYDSEKDVKTFERINKKNVYSDQEATVVLRQIKNPIPMYARYKIKAKKPKLHEPVGFDFIKGDWVAPYGKGLSADIYFKVTGSWNSFNDHDSYLHVTFPNQGDGIQSFAAKKQSSFRSPYTAPLDGYETEKTIRTARIPSQSPFGDVDVIDGTSPDANYCFRVRTALNAAGDVQEGLYGKIYGDFNFHGATLEKPYSSIVFTYYLNPTPNDRNLEFDPAQNLFTDLTPRERVKDP